MDTSRLAELLGGLPNGKRTAEVLATLTELGWDIHPVTLAVRCSKESQAPFFMTWVLNPETMKWRFGGSRVAVVRPGFSGKLTLKDALLYANDPTVIQETKPEEKKSPWER